jgi:hypothetical protein
LGLKERGRSERELRELPAIGMMRKHIGLGNLS